MQEPQIKLIDIYDISYNPWWLSGWFRGSLLVLSAALVFGGLFWLYRRYKKRVSIPYWQHAIDQIMALEVVGFDDGQAFYIALTAIVKDYLQKRYHVAVVDKTDTELLDLLKQSTVFPERVYIDLKDILEGVTYIKFAHQAAAEEKMQEACTKSIHLIQATHHEIEKK